MSGERWDMKGGMMGKEWGMLGMMGNEKGNAGNDGK